MSSHTAVLGSYDITRPADVVQPAKAADLDVAAATTLLEKESWGGKNVWGHHVGSTGGAYVKGGDVTAANYQAYKTALQSGRINAQGCGPTQLTHPSFQNHADERGGCWRWEVNVAVGFEILAQLITRYGLQDGFSRYNGSGAAARTYGLDAVSKESNLMSKKIVDRNQSPGELKVEVCGILNCYLAD